MMVYGIFFRENNSTWSEGFEVESNKIRAYSKSLQVINENGRNDLFVFTEPGLERISFLKVNPNILLLYSGKEISEPMESN